MAFSQTGLERTFNHNRGGFDTFVYRTSDAIATVAADGYFNEREFGFVSTGESPHMVDVYASDGYFVVKYNFDTETSEIMTASAETVNGLVEVVEPINNALNQGITPAELSETWVNSSQMGYAPLINQSIQRYFVIVSYEDYFQFTTPYALSGSFTISIEFMTNSTSLRTLLSTGVPLVDGFKLSMDGTTGVVSFDADNDTSTISINAGTDVNDGTLHTAKIRFDSSDDTYYLSVDDGDEESDTLAGVSHDLKYIAKDGDAGGTYFDGVVANCLVLADNANDFYPLNSQLANLEYSTTASGNSLSYIGISESARTLHTETEGGWLGNQLVSDYKWSTPATANSEWDFVANKWVLTGSGGYSALRILEAADLTAMMLIRIKADGITGNGLATQLNNSTENRIPADGSYTLIFNKTLGGALEFKRVSGVVNGALSKPEMYSLLRKPLQNIHTIGDSFNNSIFSTAFDANFTNRYTDLTYDGVGGSTLAEQKIRFDATPEYYDDVLVIMDGGLDDETANATTAIDAMVAHLTHDKWVYVQPSPAEMIEGTATRDDWNAKVAAIIAHIGEDRYVETLTALKAGNNGSVEDLEDVANNIVPRSLRSDTIHETSVGATIRTSRIAEFIKNKGW